MDLYNMLEDHHGLKQNEIDEIDIVYFMRRMARKKQNDEPKLATAEQVPWL
ncbi:MULTISPECIES: hypothetical protein [Bacillus cereus group]|uniref:hypothetical protein n=1 Tax=Bacillus cereus group TaxID=86661 RepID=UPI0002790126|nr:hypothetical protein [Bacillus paranthracis]EJQ03678.1 hypothetical protein IC5_02824 [Bacillus cereus AND1407]MCC2358945.1 hypothetical protein [Bacillus paranthracis]MCU5368401.1 hypothetical protein [Bacillus paranthracis]MCU5610524.1 hypothetical protein [Bacillus paranthracis]MDG0911678.1 hypothetical protein [Bacillus paranthracis]